MLTRIEVVEDKVLEVIVRCPQVTEDVLKLTHHIESFQQTREVVSLKVEDSIRVLKQKEIEMIEVRESELEIYVMSGEVIQTKGQLNKLYEKLDKELFAIASKSSVINIDYLHNLEVSFSGNMMAELVSGRKTLVTRRFIKEVKQRVNY